MHVRTCRGVIERIDHMITLLTLIGITHKDYNDAQGRFNPLFEKPGTRVEVCQSPSRQSILVAASGLQSAPIRDLSGKIPLGVYRFPRLG